MTDYREFLAAKAPTVLSAGVLCEPDDLSDVLFGFQRYVTAQAIRRGRSAVWLDTGLGKTLIQLEWARRSGARTLVVAPLAVCHQTVRQAAMLGIEARYVRSDEQARGPGVWVTNYEMAQRFEPIGIDAAVLDEASILKNYDGRTRQTLVRHFRPVPRLLACTATPAPNDVEELTGQAEFLRVSSRAEMLASYFIHDQNGWRLKGHAQRAMLRWLSTWAVAARRPSDLGFSDDGFALPDLRIRRHLLPVDIAADDGGMFPILGGVGSRAAVRRATTKARAEKAAELTEAEPEQQWLHWVALNDEAKALADAIPGSVDVRGNWSPEQKAEAFLAFADGQIRTLVTKPSIAAFGVNWQTCARMAFVGLSDSWESYYQAIRRCWRYGQTRAVDVHVIVSELEGGIVENVARKERQATELVARLVAYMHQEET